MRITVVIALLGALLVGCGAAPASPVRSSVSASATAQSIASSTASPASAPITSASPASTSRAAATPSPKPRATPAVPPPPTAVRIKRQGCYTGPYPDGVPPGECTVTITWKKVATKGTEIRVYGVTGCLSMSDGAGNGSCLVLHTALPPSTRKLIARAPASKGTVSWTRPTWQDVMVADTGGPDFRQFGVDRHGDDIFFAIVVAAYNEVGHSKFIIADAGTWCYDSGCQGP